MPRRTTTFLKEFVVLFGFLNGLFLSVGVNPGATLLDVLADILGSLTGDNGAIRLALTLAPLAILVAILYLIAKRAGSLGFVAVGAAFVAGLWLTSAPTSSFFLLGGALVLGYFAAR